MKLILAIFAEFLLFLALDVIGGVFYHPFHVETKLASTQQVARSFMWDGILMMLAAWLILLLFGVVRKKLATFGPHVTVALVSAAALGFFLKLGFATHNW